jgi:hypothetical protein
MKPAARCVLVLLVLLIIAGCAGAGPAARSGGSRQRCGSGSQDEQRALFYIFCVESP